MLSPRETAVLEEVKKLATGVLRDSEKAGYKPLTRIEVRIVTSDQIDVSITLLPVVSSKELF